MYPPLFFFSSQPTLLLFSASLSAVFLSLPPSSSSSFSMIIISSPLLSASLRCELMITVTNSTFVYKSPLWFRLQSHCNCVLLWFMELLCLRCISAPQVHSCLCVTWWPRCDPQPRSHWWFGDLAGKAVAQLFKAVLLCVNSGWEAGLPATVIYIYRDSWLIHLYCSIVPLSCCFLCQSYMWCATDICFYILVCTKLQGFQQESVELRWVALRILVHLILLSV